MNALVALLALVLQASGWNLFLPVSLLVIALLPHLTIKFRVALMLASLYVDLLTLPTGEFRLLLAYLMCGLCLWLIFHRWASPAWFQAVVVTLIYDLARIESWHGGARLLLWLILSLLVAAGLGLLMKLAAAPKKERRFVAPS